ncbi:MAG: hypothetical protein HYU30_01475 [Chloroflexi bacterium]|nr:hypothetical protein [Chloroflexota bacterium]
MTTEPTSQDIPLVRAAIDRPAEFTSRQRGGQPGNQNARTHGFYALCLTPTEQDALESAAGIKGLTHEIALMRVKIFSLIAEPSTSSEILIKAVRALTRMVDVQDKVGIH